MIERINRYVARRFGVGTTVGSLVRIHVWIVVFLVVLSLVLPTHNARLALRVTKNTSVVNVALSSNDPRAFGKSPFGKDRFHIAWITGSEGVAKDVGYHVFFASLLANRLPTIDGRKTVVDVYLLNAMRVADNYFTLLDAIASKPDMIVLSVNPAWAMSPIAVHQWTQLDSRAAVQLLSRPASWPIGAEFLSPSDLAWGLANSAFQPLRNRFYFSQRIHQAVDHFGPLDRAGLPAARATQKPDKAQQVQNMLPVDFWFQYRLHEPRALGPVRWAQWLQKSNEGNNEIDKTVMRAIARELRRSKIPSYVFVAPVNAGWFALSKPIQTQVGGIEHQLEQLRGDFTAPNIRYQPLTATRFVRGLLFRYRDLVHLRRAGPMGPYLAGQLCQLLNQVETKSTSCSSADGG
jgi:hypothetical protein